jgi:hypothetical protein
VDDIHVYAYIRMLMVRPIIYASYAYIFRGDRVLWMCGAHKAAPEGVTRHIRTKGELEPCELKVKAHAPMRKFSALKVQKQIDIFR